MRKKMPKFVYKVKRGFDKRSPAILTATGILSMGTAAFLAAKETPKAIRLIEEREMELQELEEELTPKEKVAHTDTDDTLRQALEKMEHHGYSAIPLLDLDGKYVGTITEGDMLWYIKDNDFPSLKDMEDISILDVERKRDNEAVNISVSMDELVNKITNQNFVPVVDDHNVFIGIITRKDVILYLANKEMIENKIVS